MLNFERCSPLVVAAARGSCAQPAARANLSVAECHRDASPSRPADSPTSSRGWSRPSSKAASSRASWSRTAAAPAATSRPRPWPARRPTATRCSRPPSALAVNMTASKNSGFEMADLRPVAIVAISPDVIAVHPSNPAKDLKEFIANAKTKSFTYGSAGVGTGPQIGAEYFFKEVAKVQIRARAVPGRRAGDHRGARQSCRRPRADAQVSPTRRSHASAVHR